MTTKTIVAHRARTARTLLVACMLTGAACAADPPRQTDGGPTGGSGGGGSGPPEPPGPGLPVPPGPGDVPKPAGTPGNLKVLDWAGFKSAVTYTFDDAQPSQLEHYAELQSTGVRHTFFITSSSNGASSNFDATFTQAVKDGHEMGNHTVHHCHIDLTGCSNTASAPASVDAELDDCNSYIAGHFGQATVWTAASPFGDSGWDAPDMSRFFLNRGVSSGSIAAGVAIDPFNLPCHAAVEGETVDNFNLVIDDVDARGKWVIFLVHTLGPTSQNWYAQIDISVITGSVAHAKMLGDVWIDSMMNVGAYWRGQNLVKAVTPTIDGGNQTWTWTLPPHFPMHRNLRITVDGGTPMQNGTPVAWDPHGYYEISLDAGSLTLAP
jgi:peptidoglycan/xylan/chitin deacetylase (PgdA/CDA1 family)